MKTEIYRAWVAHGPTDLAFASDYGAPWLASGSSDWFLCSLHLQPSFKRAFLFLGPMVSQGLAWPPSSVLKTLVLNSVCTLNEVQSLILFTYVSPKVEVRFSSSSLLLWLKFQYIPVTSPSNALALFSRLLPVVVHYHTQVSF